MQVEVWSDIVCPWCAIGRARLERALAGFAFAEDVQVRFRSFELDPSAPRVSGRSQLDLLAAKTGRPGHDVQAMLDHVTAVAAGDGLTFRLERARSGNTFDAHRLLHLAADRGCQQVVKSRLQTAYFAEGAPIGDPATLQRLAVEAGLAAEEVGEVLAGDRYAEDVRADERQAQAYGISGVPFFVIDRRYGVSGAQPAEVLLAALHQAYVDRAPAPPGVDPAVAGDAPEADCADEHCAV